MQFSVVVLESKMLSLVTKKASPCISFHPAGFIFRQTGIYYYGKPQRISIKVFYMGESDKSELLITIENALGIHARPAAMFVHLASQFESDITVRKDSDEVDGKSLMGLLMLAAGKGTELCITFAGPDADSAKAAFHDLIVQRKFDEE